GGVFFNFVFWGFGFLRMGTTGLVAQVHGARTGCTHRTWAPAAKCRVAASKQADARACVSVSVRLA
ncbi:hypothetical protein ACQCRO_26745, partial [Ralstonia pseudosolanacearum]|uniref:hypothetical protein n=1 Tax=Ralstonia pseudosolanacearum TaxID=1310165 RepID=UPI003CEE3D1D